MDSMYSSFFSDDPETVMAIYDSFTAQMSDYVNGEDYDTDVYMSIYLAREQYYRDHIDVINAHCDPL